MGENEGERDQAGEQSTEVPRLGQGDCGSEKRGKHLAEKQQVHQAGACVAGGAMVSFYISCKAARSLLFIVIDVNRETETQCEKEREYLLIC